MNFKTKIILLLIIPSLLLFLDQITKYWAFASLSHGLKGYENAGMTEKISRFYLLKHPPRSLSKTVFEPWWKMKYVENPGIVFGLFSDWDSPFKKYGFLALSLFVTLLLVVYYFKEPALMRLGSTALLFILGGALGNITDRAARGYVIDFVDWSVKGNHWPAFNLADAFITVGAVLFFIAVIRIEKSYSDKGEIPSKDGEDNQSEDPA